MVFQNIDTPQPCVAVKLFVCGGEGGERGGGGGGFIGHTLSGRSFTCLHVRVCVCGGGGVKTDRQIQMETEGEKG